MFSPHHPPPSVSDQAEGAVNRSWFQPPTLTTSEFDQNRFEDQLFSPTSPACAQLHRNRIEELLFSPTTPTGAGLGGNSIDKIFCLQASPAIAQIPPSQAKEIPFSPFSLFKEIMPPQHRGLHSFPPHPRSFDVLHSERTYLLDCLQIENRRATELLRSIPPLEERLVQNDNRSIKRRKVKKRLGWLRHRLVETNRQEKRILARLGQVTFEIQTTERWTQIEFEHRQGEVESYHERYGVHHSQLNPESAVFQPQGSQLPWAPEIWQQWQSRDGQIGCEGNYRPATEPSSALTKEFSRNVGISPDDVTQGATSSSDPNRPHRTSSMRRSSSLDDAAEPLNVYSTNITAVPVPRVKRFSLPGSPGQNIWAPAQQERGVDIQRLSEDRAVTEN
ncbi:hypothetical protein V8E51_015249 [Hyaloscypha variabilis]